MSGNRYTKKRRENCVLFLDDSFDSEETPQRLLEAGFCQVEPFVAHFQREDGGKEQKVKDPRIIRLCNRRKWLLVTTDSDIRFTHTEEIKECADLAILATAHNSVENIEEWVNARILARPRVEREFKKRQRPWYAQFNRQGAITTIYTLTESHTTRRHRPREKGQAG